MLDETPAPPIEPRPENDVSAGSPPEMPESPWAPDSPEAAADAQAAEAAVPAAPVGPPTKRSRGRGIWILVAAIVVASALVVGGLVLEAGSDEPSAAPTSPTPSIPATIAPPTGLTATPTVVPLGVNLAWTASPDAAEGYRVFRDDAQIATLPSTETTYADGTAVPGKTYQYGVVGLASTTAQSEPASATITVPTPKLSKARLTGDFTVKVTVTAAEGYTDYAKHFTIGWSFTPKCRQGPCNVRWKDLSDKDFRATLKRTAATYKGSDSGPLNARCGDTIVTSTVDISFKVVKAKAIDGAWTATRITGTIVQTEEAQLGCVATRLDQSIVGTHLS